MPSSLLHTKAGSPTISCMDSGGDGLVELKLIAPAIQRGSGKLKKTLQGALCLITGYPLLLGAEVGIEKEDMGGAILLDALGMKLLTGGLISSG